MPGGTLTILSVVEQIESTGCRGVAISTSLLLGFAIAFMITGFTMSTGESCVGVCQTIGLTLLYAGGPISGILAVFFGGVWVAWPLEITLWVVLGFASTRVAETRGRSVALLALSLVAVAMVYGLVLSQLVEIAV